MALFCCFCFVVDVVFVFVWLMCVDVVDYDVDFVVVLLLICCCCVFLFRCDVVLCCLLFCYYCVGVKGTITHTNVYPCIIVFQIDHPKHSIYLVIKGENAYMSSFKYI